MSLIVLVGGMLFGPVSATATEIVFPGSHPKLSAGAGQTVSRGPTSLFYNPANLIFVKFVEPDLDASFVKVNYTYKPLNADDYPDPGVISRTVPSVTAGLGFRPVPSFAMGVAFFPTELGQVASTPAAPIETSPGKYQYMMMQNKVTSYQIAAGAVYRLAYPFIVGAALIRTSERIQTVLSDASDPDAEAGDPIVDALYGGSWNQYAGGVRSELLDRAVVLALSYRTAATKVYDNKSNIMASSEIGGSDDFEVFEGVGYLPAVIGFGAEARFGNFGFFFDFVMEQWSAARTLYRRGYFYDYLETDYVNTNNFVGGLKWWIAPKHMIQVAGGIHGANVGNGLPAEDSSSALQTKGQAGVNMATDGTSAHAQNLAADDEAFAIQGMHFGNLKGISRMVASGGYRAKITGNGYFQLGAQLQTGTRAIPEGFNSEGTHTLQVIMLTSALAFGF